MTAQAFSLSRIPSIPKLMYLPRPGIFHEGNAGKRELKGLNFCRTGKKCQIVNRGEQVAAALRRVILPRSTYCEGCG
jgi:hypothetical protein